MDVEKKEQIDSHAGRPDRADSKTLRRAITKLDFIFLPVLTFIYFLNFLDVSARVAKPDLERP